MDTRTTAAVIVDGYMTHSACLGNLTAQQFQDANSFARVSLSALLSVLVVHEKAQVGPDVIGSIGDTSCTTRVPVLAKYFSDALEATETLPIHTQSPIATAYETLKRDYLALKLPQSYENALTDLVENFAFKSSATDVELNMARANPALYALLAEHTRLRARMYVQESCRRRLPYVPNPIRRKFFSDPTFLSCISRDSVWTMASENERLLEDIVNDARREYIDTYIKPSTTISSHVSVELPALVQLIVNESHGCGIFETASQLRRSPEVADFRVFCREIQAELASGNTIAKERIDKVNGQIRKARAHVRARLGLEKLGKELRLGGSIGIASVSTTVTLRDKGLQPRRPAYTFFYQVATAFGRAKVR